MTLMQDLVIAHFLKYENDLKLGTWTDPYQLVVTKGSQQPQPSNFHLRLAMANPSSVKVIEVCRVAPPPPSSPGAFASPSSLPLTFFDIRWLRFGRSSAFISTKCLLTLQHRSSLIQYLKPHLAQDSQKPVLSYVQGDAISLTIAESNADFYHLSSGDFVEATEYHSLVPHGCIITVFPNCGFSIGTSMHHAILDGKTSTLFVKSWAHICKHDDQSNSVLPDQLKQFYDRRVIQDPAQLGVLYSNSYRNKDGPNNRSLMFWERKPPPGSIRGTFEFTRADIETLRQLLKAKLAEQKQEDIRSVHVSTFTLACAYTWVCIVKAEEINSEQTRLAFNVDCRSRLDPPISPNYFGNCIAGRTAVAETKALFGEDGLVVAVNAISEAIKSLEKGVLDGAENWVSRLFAVTSERMLTLAGSHRFGVYETDFGWEDQRRTRAISFSDAKTDAGVVDVGLVLDKHSMQVFASLFAKGLQNP
ncbi:hypothetical protein Prudu_010158 [Prunus dulcis]|uniref:HXXXD-type acyl-transferase family protein n=1 Tax=Prunus dulcis TaxID=3755 RepID=A0A4Y1R8G4_PRUDU|nr:hypothetical protein Prudu_010158 [Prunus dulcis]